RWYQKITSSFSLSESGVLTNAETTVENQAVDFGVTTLKTVAGLAVKLGLFAGGGTLTPRTKCEAIKKEIDNLRKVKRDIIVGDFNPTTPLEGPAITVMLDKIAQKEAELAAKFIGAATVTTGTVHCELRPGDEKYDLNE